MKCVIPGTNCKILAKAIHALAKIGEEMYVEPKEKSLSFRCVGVSHSAYCDFTFYDNFFSAYNFNDLDEENALKCKISMRSALTVFKSPTMIDKLVETCHVKLEPNADTLLFIFKFKNSVVKTFFLPIIDCEDLSVPFSKDNVPNKLSAKSRVLTDAVQNFQQNLVEITVEVTPQKLLMRNYVDETSTVANSTRTQLVLTVSEFDQYTVNLDACITFCMKELRALLMFAEGVGLPLNIYFETTGKPVVFDLTNPAFEANLVLSTLNADSDDMSVSTAQESRQQYRKRAAPKKTPHQTSKASIKRPKKKSTVPNRSAKTVTTSLSEKSIRANTTNNESKMEVDEAPEFNRTNDAADSDNTHMPNRQISSNREVSKILETSRRRSDFIEATPSATSSNSSSPIVSSLGSLSAKTMQPSIFSSNWKKRPGNDTSHTAVDENVVPGSPPPPAKKAKLIFKKCFEATFNPSTMPGHDEVLADDTDEEM